MIDSKYVDAAGVKTHYLHGGSGPVLFLLHGQTPGACARVEWSPTAEHFARLGYEVFAPDQVGFGRTGNPPDFSMEFRLQHIRAFVDAISPDRYLIWGCSMGSYLGARLALADSRAERLVVMPNSHLAPEPSERSAERPRMGNVLRAYVPSLENARAILEAIVFDRSTVSDELVRDFYEMSTGENSKAERERRLAAKPRPIFEDLKALQTPTLILWGRDDTPNAMARAASLFEVVPNAELVVLHRAGHWPQRDRFSRANELVDTFFRSVALGSRDVAVKGMHQ